jgi:hypothetical protein
LGGTVAIHPVAPPTLVVILSGGYLNALITQTIAVGMPAFFANKNQQKQLVIKFVQIDCDASCTMTPAGSCELHDRFTAALIIFELSDQRRCQRGRRAFAWNPMFG